MDSSTVGHVKRLVGTWIDTLVFKWTDRRFAAADVNDRPGGNPLVSIVIPTLCKDNHAHRIADLRDLLYKYLPAQTYSNYEAIVISDGPNVLVQSLVEELNDPRLHYLCTAQTSGFGGLPETSLGFEVCKGKFCLRMNDDNRPYRNYLAALLSGFDDDVDFVYARVVFSGEARTFWCSHFAGMTSYILPNDKAGTIHANNVDWMNFMFRACVARMHREAMCRSWHGDWAFISELLAQQVSGRFVDRLVGHKR